MKIEWTRRAILVAIAGFIIIAGFFYFMTMNVIAPARAELEQAIQMLDVERQMLSELQQQESGDETINKIKSSVRLQQQLPVNALMDQLLLALARAEGISDTYLTSIEIEESVHTDFLAGEEVNKEEKETGMTFFPEISDPYENEQGSTESSSKVESLPISLEGLRTVRLHVKIQASDYKGLARFTEEIDRLDRIMNIDSISYISPTERMRVGDTVDPLEFRVVISAFYFPELAEGLQEETPLLDYPRPSGKRSPLYNE